MSVGDDIVFEGDSKLEHYQVVDTVYVGRKARVLFSGNQSAAQSGIAHDDNPDLLFDYNQRFLELISSVRPKRILLIGGGAYTLPIAVLSSFSNIYIDVVERDPELIKIAKRFFGLKPNKRLRVMHQNARDYLGKNDKLYDMILVDAFIHNKMPRELTTHQAVEQLHANTSPKGVVATNVISPYYGPAAEVLRSQYAAYCSVFNSMEIFPADRIISPWISQNFLIVANKGRERPNYNLRFLAMEPLQVDASKVLYD